MLMIIKSLYWEHFKWKRYFLKLRKYFHNKQECSATKPHIFLVNWYGYSWLQAILSKRSMDSKILQKKKKLEHNFFIILFFIFHFLWQTLRDGICMLISNLLVVYHLQIHCPPIWNNPLPYCSHAQNPACNFLISQNIFLQNFMGQRNSL